MLETSSFSWPHLRVEVSHRLSLIQSDPEASAVAAQLELIGSRLGTSAECESDEVIAQMLGHRLRNLVCGLTLRASLAEGDAQAASARS